MNRHGYPNEHVQEEEEEDDPGEANVEMPLPTYEEVVGAASHSIGFKDDLLAPGPAYRGGGSAGSSRQMAGHQRASLRTNGGDVREPTYTNARRKHCGVNFIVGIIGIAVIPLLILFIVLQLKNCRACEHPQEVSHEDERIKFNLEQLEHCNTNLRKIERRYGDVFSDLQSVRKEHEELLINQRSADKDLKDLRYQYNTALSDATNLQAEVDRLHKEIENYESLITKARDDLKEQKNT